MKARRTATLLRETATALIAGLLIVFGIFILALSESRNAWPSPADVAASHLLRSQAETAGSAGVLAVAARDSGFVVSSHAAESTSNPTVHDHESVHDLTKAAPEAAQSELRVAIGPIHVHQTPLPAAPKNRTFAIWAMTLFFAAMCAVTLGFWQHIRREYASPRRK